jgi:hypothetical protein
VLNSIYILHNEERTLLEPKVSSGDAVRPVLGGTANKFRGRRTPIRELREIRLPFFVRNLGGPVTAETQPARNADGVALISHLL